MIDPDHRRRVISTSVGLSLGGLLHFATLLNLSTDLGRTAKSGFFSGVYEVQARALLEGRIALPEGSMSIEGFVRDGQTFMYFPPWPAILRLPVLMTTHEFDGRLSLLSMALAWIVFATMTTKFVWLIHHRLTGSNEVRRTDAVLVALFLACAGGGTFLTFDAGLPWVYHEVYSWAIAGAVGALYWLTRVLIEPDAHALRWLGAFCLITIGTRATSGWALCLTAVAVALWFRFRPPSSRHRCLWGGVALAALIPLALSIALNLYKFDHVYMFPLQDQVWTQVNEHRRDALEANGGAITGLQFFPTAFQAYLGPTGIRFVDYFPWITLPAHPPVATNGAFVDQAYRTGSATTFMPLFMLLQIISVVVVFLPWSPKPMRVLRVPMIAAVLITGGVMAYGYFAARYASEFVPALVLGGAVGTCLLAALVRRRPRVFVPTALVVGSLTAFSLLAQASIGLTWAAYHAGGSSLVRYVTWQRDLSPSQQAALVTRSDELPADGETDELRIIGDCDALYLNTGDAYEPWVTVESRGVAIRIHPDGRLRPGRVPLFRIPGNDDAIMLEVTKDKTMRFILIGTNGEYGGNDLVFPPSGYIQLGVRNRTGDGYYEIAAEPGGVIGFLSSRYTDDDWFAEPAVIGPSLSAQDARKVGVRVEQIASLDLPLCESLAATLAASPGT